MNSPFIEVLKKKGYEVLLCLESMDEDCITQLKEYKDFKLVDCSKDDIEVPLSDEEKAQKAQQKEDLQTLCRVTKDVLGDKVEKVVISDRLAQQPAAVSTAAFGWSSNWRRSCVINPLEETIPCILHETKANIGIEPRSYHCQVSPIPSWRRW